MKLKKINEEHYVVVDETEIKEGDWMYNPEREPSLLQCIGKGSIRGWKKITHSTQPIEIIHTFGATMTNPPMGYINIIELPLSEVKELLGEVDVQIKAEKEREKLGYTNKFITGFVSGYTQAIEDNKERKYTEGDIIEVVRLSLEDAETSVLWSKEWYPRKLADKILQSLQPKTQWEVDIINGKLTLI